MLKDGDTASQTLPVLELMFIITDWDKAHQVEEALIGDGVFLVFQFMAEGTASSEILDILGLGSTDKAVTISVLPCGIGLRLMADVTRRLGLRNSGNGIAFMTALSGASKACGMILKDETLDNISKTIEREANKMELEHTHDLILAIINRGFSSEVMDCAREAGATGGTVIHARQMGAALPAKFAGVSISEEKEIIMILTDTDSKMSIMSAVNKAFGLVSKAQGLFISLPVDAVMGI